MPAYDIPIKTDEKGLPRLMSVGLPILLYLFRTPSDELDAALKASAAEYAGDILVAKVNINENPALHAQYGSMAPPALVTLDEGRVESRASRVRPSDVEDHADFLAGQGPYPQASTAEQEARAASGATPMPVSEATWQTDVLESDLAVLVDFWAAWCAPCHAIAPAVDNLAAQYAGQVKVVKLNVDENRRIAVTYQVMSLPTLMTFSAGKPVGRLLGAHPQANIEQLIRGVL
jgi:thioredoxin 1